MTKEERKELDDFFYEKEKHASAFVKQDGMFETNEHGAYIYTSTNGYSSINLISILILFKEYLIENQIVKSL